MDRQETDEGRRRNVLDAPASGNSVRKILADLFAGMPRWRWIAVAANRWEFFFILLPPIACLTFMGLQLVIGEPDFLYRAAWLARKTVCMFGDVVALCRAEEWFDWTPGFSLLALVNVAALFSTVVLLSVMVLRRWEGAIVFRRPKEHWFTGLFVLVCVLAFFWGILFYYHVSLLGAVVMSGISVMALNRMRHAAACLLLPSASKSPTSGQAPTSSRWYGPPIRRARFAPEVETGEPTEENQKK